MFIGKMCVFVSRPMKIVTFLRENGHLPKRVVDFARERDTFRNKIMDIVEDFDEQSYNNNGKHLNSSRILRVKSKNLEIFKILTYFIFVFCLFFLVFVCLFFPFLSFFFPFFHLFPCFHFPFCAFVHFYTLQDKNRKIEVAWKLFDC